jgi:cytochrome b6-f complex subunit 5
MVENLLSGIVLGFIFITLLGLFIAAYLQYKRSI